MSFMFFDNFFGILLVKQAATLQSCENCRIGMFSIVKLEYKSCI